MRDILKSPFLANSKIALPRETIRFFASDHLYIFKNRAPARSILEISSTGMDENDAPVRSIRKIWIISNDHVERFYINSISNCSTQARLLRLRFEGNRSVRSILKIMEKIALPCGASACEKLLQLARRTRCQTVFFKRAGGCWALWIGRSRRLMPSVIHLAL